MELIFSGLRFETCLIYLVDVILYEKTFAAELWHLEEVFARFNSLGLELEPGKLVLFQMSVMYLGHVVFQVICDVIAGAWRKKF